jgi:threonylcarbamoyladenosine tRNA methylthiotransferase MtaB
MKATLYNLGCKVNFADGAQIEKLLKDAGAEIVRYGEPADLVLINTCTVTAQADADSRKMLRRAVRRYTNAFIAVTGCFAQLRRDEIMQIDGVDAVFGQDEKFRLIEILNELKTQQITLTKPLVTQFFINNTSPCEFHSSSSSECALRTRIVLKLQDGCDYRCSYCAVPDARGTSRSMPFSEIPSAIDKITEDGYVEIILSGINLGEYCSPGGERFVDVIRLLSGMTDKARFRISSIEPNLLTNEIIQLVASSKNICPHFHIPLQSGSDAVLQAMRRRYKSSTFESLINKIKDAMPDCCIGVDLIAGFPGETEADFETTYKLIESLPVSYLHAFTYSERQGTPAAEIKPKVAHQIKKERTIALRDLSHSKLVQFYNSQLGQIKSVIPETYNEKSGLWCGWSENYIRCAFKAIGGIKKQPVNLLLKDIESDKVICA